MPSIYERLFELYGDAVLKDCNCCKSDEINQFTSALGVEDDMEVVISDYLVDSYYRWSTNACREGFFHPDGTASAPHIAGHGGDFGDVEQFDGFFSHCFSGFFQVEAVGRRDIENVDIFRRASCGKGFEGAFWVLSQGLGDM